MVLCWKSLHVQGAVSDLYSFTLILGSFHGIGRALLFGKVKVEASVGYDAAQFAYFFVWDGLIILILWPIILCTFLNSTSKSLPI